jgi:hypothetical protein
VNGLATSAALVLLAITALRAQEPALPDLHRAWLSEIMDLDVAAATEGYQRVAAGSQPGDLERWVAAARLLELRRCGVDVPPPANGDVPGPLRELFKAAAPPLPASELLPRAKGDPRDVVQRAATEEGRVPALRTAVPQAEEWVLRQVGPSMRDRLRQRFAATGGRGRSTGDSNRYPERLYAFDILRAELQGRTAQADALRTLYFGDWRPPAATGDAATAVARIRTNLAAWLRDPALSTQLAAPLRDLSEAIEQRAAADPANALALVLRLPIYAERLLAEQQPSGR